ncbi:nuclease-related domain-containing protein [Caballeronia sp. LZ001]|uniref:nuclease-related domain-containing protein n=1 Tax=Caballeronia sp. LZ001 TaxID=3038553 RepID=UPI002855A77E|nr:nuclease-related domain-containing protein [Caballeronia sp. LZ001]MDR5806303.1 nuclease-related domain-containing protein [Caballeronia sp. LZ001]
MLIKLLIAVGGYHLYRRSKGRRRSRTSHSARTAPRWVDAIGAAGEAATEAKLRKSLRCLCGEEFYLHDGPLVIEHAPGTAFPTAEIDHLAITPFGIFVFEMKNWSGHIAPSLMPGNLTRTSQHGEPENRRSPIAQNRTKLRFVREQLPGMWPVAGAGVFTSPTAVLDWDLPIDLLSLEELPYWLRLKRDSFKERPPIDIRRATAAVLMYADNLANAHIARKAWVAA